MRNIVGKRSRRGQIENLDRASVEYGYAPARRGDRHIAARVQNWIDGLFQHKLAIGSIEHANHLSPHILHPEGF
jgi:hypothetical protein